MERKIEIGTSFEFSARGKTLVVDIAALSDSVLAQAVLHGLKQTISDAASNAAGSAYDGAKAESAPAWKDLPNADKRAWTSSNVGLVEQEALALMEKRIAALVEGDWTTRAAAAPGMTKFEQYAAELLAGKMTFAAGTKKPERLRAALEHYKTLADAQRGAVNKLVQARIDREREEAALDIDLGF